MLSVDLIAAVLSRHLKHVPRLQPAAGDSPLAADHDEDRKTLAAEELLVEHEALSNNSNRTNYITTFIAVI